MTLVLNPTPIGVDLVIDRIQKKIYLNNVTNGTWTNYQSYHRAYKNETPDGIRPEIFTGNGNNEYHDAFTNDDFCVTSFFLVPDDATDIVDGQIINTTISIIFQVNLEQLYPNAPKRFDEEFKNEVVNSLKNLGFYYEFSGVFTSLDDVYAGLDISKVQWDDMHRRHVVRFEVDVNYRYSCTDEYARGDCTVKVSVSATPETAVGADDGTATANVTDSQGGITFLWDDPLAQTTQVATGLTPGTYTVVVTDDNALSCTAQGVGTVAEAVPPPVCNLEITGITPIGTTYEVDEGTATVAFSGNSGLVSFAWDDPLQQTTNPAIGLAVGDYCVAISDSGVGATCIKSAGVSVPSVKGNYLKYTVDDDTTTLASSIGAGANENFIIALEFRTPSPNNFQTIITGDVNGHYVGIRNNTEMAVRFGGSLESFLVPTMLADTWYYAVFNRIGNIIRLYLNGVQSVTTQSTSNAVSLNSFNKYVAPVLEFEGGVDNVLIAGDIYASEDEIAAMTANPQDAITILEGLTSLNGSFYSHNSSGTSTALVDSLGTNDGTLDAGFTATRWIAR